MLHVTKSFLPDLQEYTAYLQKIWDSGWITNNGPLVQELELRIKDRTKANHLFFCGNGTIVLQMAIKALGLKKEIITTPYSYVATTNAIIWEGCRPVFIDVNDRDFNIDVDLIENQINENTEAILATHVYGNPCDIERIQKIATKYNLSVIYDGAHAFGTTLNGESILNAGDITTCSLHATKLFHSGEGGLLITQDTELAKTLMLERQFGHVYDDYQLAGINGKNSELHAAMGLCVLNHLDEIIAHRKHASEQYDKKLNLEKLQRPISFTQIGYNYAYYPVLFKDEQTTINVKHALEKESIYPRRYFYPSLNTLPYLGTNQSCPIAESAAIRVLSLPLSDSISERDIERVSEIINKNI